jgi:hypothetical protein
VRRLFAVIALVTAGQATAQRTWTADNGKGTFSNPLFYDEFSDPDLIASATTSTSPAHRCTRCRDYRCCIRATS